MKLPCECSRSLQRGSQPRNGESAVCIDTFMIHNVNDTFREKIRTFSFQNLRFQLTDIGGDVTVAREM